MIGKRILFIVNKVAEKELSMENYDIGLVVISTYNYGNDLTNYSLYAYLKSLGYKVLLIAVPWDERCFVPHYSKDKKGLFIENPIGEDLLSEKYESRWDLIDLNKYCKMFIVGSDQLWNNSYIKASKYYTCLDWVSSEKYKIAYSTSIGSGFGNLDVDKVLVYLKRFQKISLREKQSVELFNKEYGLSTIHVMDPVFLSDKECYQKLAEKGIHNIKEEAFLGAYLLEADNWKQKIVSEVTIMCGKMKKVVVSLPPWIKGGKKKEMVRQDLKTEEWLAFIEKSNFFITDSFHGLCFSLIFQKQFIVLFNKNSIRGIDRITSLLRLVGLEKRLIVDNGDVCLENILKEKIDYTYIRQILDKTIKDSKDWLKQSVEDGVVYSGKEDSFDILVKDYYDSQKALEVSNVAYRKLKMQRWLEEQKEKHGIEKMVAWGAGGCFLEHINEIKRIYDIDMVFDKDAEKWGENYCPGIECLPTEKICEQKNVIVLIMANFENIQKEIQEELQTKGIQQYITFMEWEKMILRI